MTRVFVSRDMASVALGADTLAEAFAQAGCTVVRTGSRGLFSIEPLVEVQTTEGRVGYGPVGPEDVAAVLNGSHPNRLGDVAALPFFAAQQRFTFARCGLTDPLSLQNYAAHSGWRGLAAARAGTAQAVVDAVKASGLRGRGGAGFPTGIKWQTVLDTAAVEKFIVCNADEGDSGTFADRMLMEGDPFCLLEGMAIAAHAVGAGHGYIYIRSEYPFAVATMRAAIAPGRRRRLYLRLGNLAPGIHRGQTRPGPGQAAGARHHRPVRPADGHQQRPQPRRHPFHPGRRPGGLRGRRLRPLTRPHPGAARRPR